MKNATTGKTLKAKQTGTDWTALDGMTPEEIHSGIENDPDAMPTDAAFWESAKVVMPKSKKVVTIRLDADLLEWLKQESGYQTKINAILRTYMDGHKHHTTR